MTEEQAAIIIELLSDIKALIQAARDEKGWSIPHIEIETSTAPDVTSAYPFVWPDSFWPPKRQK